MKKLDVAIVGAGSAGLSARSIVSKHTDNYALFDAGTLGTTCARVGCMPSKVLIQVAEDFHRRQVLEQEGIFGSAALSIDLEKSFAHVRSLRDRFVRAVMKDMESWQNTHLVPEKVSLQDKNILLTQSGEKYSFDKLILACGSKPVVPKVLEGYENFYSTTDDFFELTKIPKRWVVIGTGVIGMELGQALNRLGCEVTLLGRRKSMAGITDPDILEYSISKLRQEVPILYDEIEKVEQEGAHLKVQTKSQTLLADRVLLAAGRTSNVNSMDLGKAGFSVDKKGIPAFDPQTMLLKGTDHVFIAGDANAELMILHEASDEGRIAGINAVSKKVNRYMRRTPLGITFTDPNIAFAGKKFSELKQDKIAFETGKVSFEGQGRSIVKLKEKGLLHIYADTKTGQVLGAEMFGPDAEHLAHLIAWSIGENLTIDDMLAKPFYHPVIEEGLRSALRSIKKGTYEIEIPSLT